MAAFSFANLKRTWYYLKKNGFRAACLAVAERLSESRQTPYVYEAPAEDTLKTQRETAVSRIRISVVVPAFSPRKEHLTALLDSLCAQTYPHWELVIADAGPDDETGQLAERWAGAHGLFFERIPRTPGEAHAVGKNVRSGTALSEEWTGPDDLEAAGGERVRDAVWREKAVRCLKLQENRGISRNTDAGLACVRGDYTGLLDHDDLLTPDALFEVAAAVEAGKRAGQPPLVLYSDEDKCDGTGTRFFEPNRKPELDLDLLLSNNYICHFLVMESGLIRELGMRAAFDGAQDYDLVLRAAERGVPFFHVKKVLYHWRCHGASTAQNPESKGYAYEAGKRAVEDFLERTGRRAEVSHLKHLGFYRADYEGDLFAQRPDLGAVAYPLPPRGGRFRSGIYETAEGGEMRYAGLRNGFSGPLHRAALQQEADAADLRAMRVRPELSALYGQALARALDGGGEARMRAESLAFCGQMRGMGYRILWDPQGAVRNKGTGSGSGPGWADGNGS